MHWLFRSGCLILACLAAFAVVNPAYGQSVAPSPCVKDTQIDVARNKAIDTAAMDFVQLLLGPNPASGYDSLSLEQKTKITRDQLASQAGELVQQFKPKNLAIQHTYLIRLKQDSPGRVACIVDLTKPYGWEALRAVSIPEQAYVMFSADTVNNHLAITVWLIPEQKTWKVQSFSANVSSLGEDDAMQLWDMAHTQQTQGRFFNAALLYAAALQTADRGPDFQMGIAPTISEESAKLALPPEIKGRPPFEWKNGGKTWNVVSVGPIAIAGKLYVMIGQEVPAWQNDSQVDGWNKELLKYFKVRFPEYSAVFSGVVIRAYEKGGTRGYGTVDENPAGK